MICLVHLVTPNGRRSEGEHVLMSRRSILQNILHVFSGQALAMLCGLVTHAYLARVLGPGNYGIIGFAVSVVSYFGILASLGTDMWGARTIARQDREISTITADIVSLRLALSLVSLVLLIALVSVWQESSTVNAVILIQAASLFIAALTLDFAFQGLERLDVAARRQMIAAVIALVGMLVFMQYGGSAITATIVFQAAAFVAALYAVVIFRRTVAILPLRINFAAWKNILRASVPFAVTGVVNAIYFSIDVVIIGLVLSKEEVGLYVAAGRVLTVGLSVAGVFTTAFMPVLSRLVAERDSRRQASLHLARSVIFTGGLIASGGFLLAPEIIHLLFGSGFAGAEQALRILMINLAATHVLTVYHLQLMTWNHERAQMVIMIAGATLNVLLNLIFIPRFGIEAAAATTLASTLFVMALAYIVLARHGDECHGLVIVQNTIFFGVAAWGGYAVLAVTGHAIETPAGRFIVFGTLLALLYGAIGWGLGIIRPAEISRYLTRNQN